MVTPAPILLEPLSDRRRPVKVGKRPHHLEKRQRSVQQGEGGSKCGGEAIDEKGIHEGQTGEAIGPLTGPTQGNFSRPGMGHNLHCAQLLTLAKGFQVSGKEVSGILVRSGFTALPMAAQVGGHTPVAIAQILRQRPPHQTMVGEAMEHHYRLSGAHCPIGQGDIIAHWLLLQLKIRCQRLHLNCSIASTAF